MNAITCRADIDPNLFNSVTVLLIGHLSLRYRTDIADQRQQADIGSMLNKSLPRASTLSWEYQISTRYIYLSASL